MSLKEQIRKKAEADLVSFIRLVHPNRVLGHVHEELIYWWNREQAKSHQLVLLPRDHQKSTMLAYRVAWEITRNPSIRILYISATSNLAVKQLKFIKDILTSDIYRFYWPEMINPDEGKREKWTETEIAVDHPKRKQELVRDPTVFTAGLTTTIVGMHCDIACLDDVVIDDTADDESGRAKVRTQVSYLASIAGTDAKLWAVGTRYHPKDLYQDMIDTSVDLFDEDGNVIDQEELYELFERQVESHGDGTGEFLWPRKQRKDGKWFGFNREILAKKKAQYYDQTKFRAQYYNNPNDASTSPIQRKFNYYEREHIRNSGGKWFYKDRVLNVFAAIDFAYSTRKTADSTALVVVGMDKDHNVYILDIERIKTNKISDYFELILKMHSKWNFRKLRAEVSVAQEVIVEDLKNNYIKPHGLVLAVEGHRPMTKKEDRMLAVLQPRYHNDQIFHYRGGNCELLEEELVLQKPPHDDIKDALTNAIEICVAPSFMSLAHYINPSKPRPSEEYAHKRFGGIG